MAKEDVKYDTRKELLEPKGKNKVKQQAQGKEPLPFPEIPRKK
ncbi:MAG: hypothetical protein PHU31_09740 [Anaerotignum sp.]|nr:hypothetical protein [Anaerotignum sp.]